MLLTQSPCQASHLGTRWKSLKLKYLGDHQPKRFQIISDLTVPKWHGRYSRGRKSCNVHEHGLMNRILEVFPQKKRETGTSIEKRSDAGLIRSWHFNPSVTSIFPSPRPPSQNLGTFKNIQKCLALEFYLFHLLLTNFQIYLLRWSQLSGWQMMPHLSVLGPLTCDWLCNFLQL